MLEKFVLTILELNWNQRLGHKRIKLNICHHMLTSSTQLQNRSFDVVERTRTSAKCQKMKNARAKHAKILFFIVKYANLRGFCCRRRRGCLSSLMFQCGNNNELALQHGGFCTTWSLVAKGLVFIFKWRFRCRSRLCCLSSLLHRRLLDRHFVGQFTDSGPSWLIKKLDIARFSYKPVDY